MLGIMSDSHDDLRSIRDAVAFFNDRGVDMVLHAGDIVAPGVITGFEELEAPLKVVWGNNDGDKVTLKHWFEKNNAEILGHYGDLEISGRRVFMLHGTNETIVESLAKNPDIDVVVRGHTHREDIKENPGLVVNPGEVGGLLTGRRTVATLDLEKLEARVHHL